MKTWFLYPQYSAPMPVQMALDEVVFGHMINKEELAQPDGTVLRFYFSSEPWISLGYLQKMDVQRLKNPVCRRITGGGMVYHGEDIIFSLIARKSAHPSFSSVKESYIKIHEALIGGLSDMGISARMYRCSEPLPKGNECFQFPICSDVAVGKEKIAGGSQKRSQQVLLHQESIQMRNVDSQNLITHLTVSIEKTFGVTVIPSDLPLEFLREADRLKGLKYPDLRTVAVNPQSE